MARLLNFLPRTKPRDFIADTLNRLNDLGVKFTYEYNPRWPKNLRIQWGQEVRISGAGGVWLRFWAWLTMLALPVGFVAFCILNKYFAKSSMVPVEGFFGCAVVGYVFYQMISERIAEDFNRRIRFQLEQRAISLAYEPARMIIEALMVYHAVKYTRPWLASKKALLGSNQYPNNLELCILPPLMQAIELTFDNLNYLTGKDQVAARAVREEYDKQLSVAAMHVSDLWDVWDASICLVDLFWRSIGHFLIGCFLLTTALLLYSLVSGKPL